MKDKENQKAHNHLLNVSKDTHPKIWSLVSNNGLLLQKPILDIA